MSHTMSQCKPGLTETGKCARARVVGMAHAAWEGLGINTQIIIRVLEGARENLPERDYGAQGLLCHFHHA